MLAAGYFLPLTCVRLAPGEFYFVTFLLLCLFMLVPCFVLLVMLLLAQKRRTFTGQVASQAFHAIWTLSTHYFSLVYCLTFIMLFTDFTGFKWACLGSPDERRCLGGWISIWGLGLPIHMRMIFPFGHGLEKYPQFLAKKSRTIFCYACNSTIQINLRHNMFEWEWCWVNLW